MLQIPAFFFPTTVLVLDDDKHFSQMLKQLLGKQFIIRTFSDPDEIAHYLNQKTVCMEKVPLNTFPLTSPQKVRSFLQSGASHHLVSVLITDYQLEKTTGLELLEKLNPPHIKRILMSNFADSAVVNQAYNDCVIDAFLPKLDQEFISKLKNTIEDMQKRFFINYCNDFFEAKLNTSKLCDKTFADFFTQMLAKFEITRLVTNNDLSMFELESERRREKIYLHVAEKQDFDDLIDSIQGEKASPVILDRIKQRLAFPCFRSGNIPDGELWSEFMRPVTAILGENTYYVSCDITTEDISLHAT